ncbi:MAG: molybdopterin molybdotransferase MoeA [Bacteroidota bacterium]
MIEVQEALDLVYQHRVDLGSERIPLSRALHRVLKEDWHSDRDLPPYNRVTMDGIAIAHAAWEGGQRRFPIVGVAAAGMSQRILEDPSTCLEAMTGAMLPRDSDTVIRYEDLHIEEGYATVQADWVNFRQNVHFQGMDRAAGSLIVKANTRISAAEIGVGASIGKHQVEVARLPRTIVISTGNELVEIDQSPLLHQIRRSNVYRLMTSLQAYQIQADMDHLQDEPEQIREKLRGYLDRYDVIILSGGVSKGKYDYLPRILAELQVEKLFHRIKQRPGKPFWFGRLGNSCTIFALPGNPVSSFLCMQRYFRPWLEWSQGGALSPVPSAVLQEEVYFKPDLTYFLEVSTSYDERGRILAQPQRGNGSGDLANLVDADAFIELPRGREVYAAGEVFPIYYYR